MKTIRMYDYACRSDIKAEEECIINMGLAYYQLGSVDAIYAFHAQYTKARIMLDLRIQDEDDILDEKIAFDAGADLVSISGLADDRVLAEAQEVAEASNASLIMNLAGVSDADARLVDADLCGIEYALLPAGAKLKDEHYAVLGQYGVRKYRRLDQVLKAQESAAL